MLKVGDLVEILEPEERYTYPYNWVEDMDNYIGDRVRISKISLDETNRICYYFDDNPWTWHESNLKFIRRDENIQAIDINETVVVIKGEEVGQRDTVIKCYAVNNRTYYDLKYLGYKLPGDHLKPLKQATELF